MRSYNRIITVLLLLCFCAGCASVGTLEGGKKDVQPPKLVAISPADSLLNTRVTKIELRFDEYVTLNDPGKEIQISPLLSIPPTVTSINKRVTIKIPDSLLMENTTYRVSFGSSVKDIHEDNKITGLTYTFSTGAYFDSLEVNGQVLNARTGLPDSASMILLYPATADDSAVIRSRPLYVTKVGAGGSFSLKGLPAKKFRIYALSDANDNLIYDGGKEKIAFTEQLAVPGDSLGRNIMLRTFEEITDTSMHDTTTLADSKERRGSTGKPSTNATRDTKDAKVQEFTYLAGVDTSDITKRTKEITKPIEIIFNRDIQKLTVTKIRLGTDTISDNEQFTATVDSLRKNVLRISSLWKEDAIYTLRLLKGFAQDSTGAEAMPSKYVFHTKRDDDYSKLTVNLPSQYKGDKYILLIKSGADTIHYKQVADTAITVTRLSPGNYDMRIIVDENKNGIWDTGDLLLKKQPELVIPYKLPVTLKAGWDNVVDFEVVDNKKDRNFDSPGKRDKETRK